MSDTNDNAAARTPAACVHWRKRTPIVRAARLPLLALAAVSAAGAIAGCGGQDAASPSSVAGASANGQTVPAQTATAPPAATATTPTATTPTATTPSSDRANPAASDPQAAAKGKDGQPATKAAVRPARKGTTKRPPTTASPARPPVAETDATPPPADGATPLAPTAPTGTQQDPAGSNPPLDCLEQARLEKPVKYMNNLWGAKTRGGADILVDGPYGSETAAEHSASTLRHATRAEAGGHYVVSAALREDVGQEVSAVARCLKDKSPRGPQV